MNEEYYSKNAKGFIEGTIEADMSELRSLFVSYLPKDAKDILDLGFGSGRDSLAFQQNYNVISLDPVEEFCEHGRRIGLKNVILGNVESMTFQNKFDGIWACASLLHVPSSKLNDAFKRCSIALRYNGVMYVSFKLGNFEGIRGGRYYLDLDESSLKKCLLNTNLVIEKTLITNDVRPDKKEQWLNVILIKK